jgi:hypothetical protein
MRPAKAMAAHRTDPATMPEKQIVSFVNAPSQIVSLMQQPLRIVLMVRRTIGHSA